MPNTLRSPRVTTTLERLFEAAARDDHAPRLAVGASASPQELADAAAAIYMPISAAGGDLLYSLVRAAKPATVVEFGTSFAISTIYLAAALRDNGAGRIVTTELNTTKIAAAQRNLTEAGLDDLVTILPGDAMRTLATVQGPIGFVLLDGWKDLCLPVLNLLEPQLPPGTLVVADDSTFDTMADYVAYVRDPANGYVTTAFPVEDGMEVSLRA